mgnify:FL=1
MPVVARGETEGSFAMSELSGIVSLFLIAAAFLTSCNNQQPPKSLELTAVVQDGGE